MNPSITEEQLPRELTLVDAVAAGHADQLERTRALLERDVSVLIECSKALVSPFQAVLRRAGLPVRVVDGRPPQGSAGSGPSLARAMVEQLQAFVRGGVHDAKGERLVLLVSHLELFASPPGSLSPEAREFVALVYENPHFRWVAFCSPGVPLPPVIADAFTRKLELSGLDADCLGQLVTRREARKLGRGALDLGRLHACVAGLDVAQLRALLASLDFEDYPDNLDPAWDYLRAQGSAWAPASARRPVAEPRESAGEGLRYPESRLPEAISLREVVDIAYSVEVGQICTALRDGRSLLVECAKGMAPFVYTAVRARLRREGVRCDYVDGRDPAHGLIAPDMKIVAAMVIELATKLARPHGDGARVMALPHLDLLMSSRALAEQLTEVLEANPATVWLGFWDRQIDRRESLPRQFEQRVSLLNLRHSSLHRLVTQAEARALGPGGLDVDRLYALASKVDPIRLRRISSSLVDEPPDSIWDQLEAAVRCV